MLRQFVARTGETDACNVLDVSRHTLARAAAGFPLGRGTRTLIRIRLAEYAFPIAA